MGRVNKLVFTFFISISTVFSQSTDSLYIQYKYFDNLFNKEYKADMYINNNQSTYRLFCGNEETKPELKDNTINIGSSLIDIYFKTDLEKDSIFTYNILDIDILEIKEVLPNINWNLNLDETKVIGDFICKKATTKFRGRTYTAWYSPNIETPFGPWKLNGLPGLIFEAYDETKTFIWQITSLEKLSLNYIEIPYKEVVTLSLLEYLDKVKERLEKLRARVRGSLPRGTQVSVPKNSRNGLELIYEWEE